MWVDSTSPLGLTDFIKPRLNRFNTIQYGLNTTAWGAIMAPLVTLVLLKVEGRNLVAWGF